MDRIALIVLMACWVLWLWPFLAYKARAPKRQAQVTVKASNWGVIVQSVAYFCAWLGRPAAKPTVVLIAGMLFGFLAVALSWASIRNLGKQLRVQAGLYADHELVRSGPYRFVRHPIYAGMLAIYLATALIQSSWIMTAIGLVFIIVGTEMRVRIEDDLLASRFGAQFAQYKASTPAYIPLVR